ncbi:SixA phosphatase family protein [Marinicella rhabdoformis]|uniref:SixA phosphatase family protein n=1 Tax=Marinicella rhabdoformis TaxID=2580566 RepID=UPI0012AEC19E|nr:histidine phosphatase family protein [Marinicella rhabdoformis]
MNINLFIVRHGHSPFLGNDDFSRPLSESGCNQASQVGTFIAQNILNGKTKIITSAAQRTLSTTANICQSLTAFETIELRHLYSASVGDWCDVITEHAAENLILVGHNPTISQLHQYLTQSQSQGFTPATTGHLILEIASDGLKLPAHSQQIFLPN